VQRGAEPLTDFVLEPQDIEAMLQYTPAETKPPMKKGAPPITEQCA